MKKLIIFLVVFAVFGCTKRIYVPVTNTITEIEYRDRLLRDSVYFSDSILIEQKGDTVFNTKIKYRYINKLVRDTVNRFDSVYVEKPIPVETTKEIYKLTKWQTWRLKVLNILMATLFFLTLWKFRKPIFNIIKKIFGF